MISTRTIDVGNARLQMHLAGRGPLAVLVHGYPLDHRMWLDLLHGPLAMQRTLAAVDLRGHGGSPWVLDRVHSMELFAKDLAAVIRTLGDGPADVVALSMGGYAALALCEAEPGLVHSLALVDTRAAADSEAGKVARTTTAQQVLERGRRWLADQMLPKLVAAQCEPSVRARVQTIIEATAVETILADLEGMRERKDRSALLPRLAMPTLVVVGAEDAITPVAEATAMRDTIPGAELVVVDGAGHLVPVEQPRALAAALGAFWERVS